MQVSLGNEVSFSKRPKVAVYIKYDNFCLVKNHVRVTESRTFKNFIFPMQVSLGNEESFGKRAKATAFSK